MWMFYSAKQKYEDGDRQGTLIGCYVIALTNDFIGKTLVIVLFYKKDIRQAKNIEKKLP